MKSSILKCGFDLFQAMIVKVIGHRDGPALDMRNGLKAILLLEEARCLRHLSGRELREQYVPFLPDRCRFVGGRGRGFHSKARYGQRLRFGLHDLQAFEQIECLGQLII